MATLTILKSISTMLDQDHILILAYMYYSNIKNRDENQYRFEIRIEKVENLKDEIKHRNDNLVEKWTWPGIDNMICKYAKIDTNRSAVKWLKARLAKTIPFNEFKSKIAVPWHSNGWLSKDYVISEGGTKYDLTKMNESDLLALKTNRLFHISNRAESTKPNYLE